MDRNLRLSLAIVAAFCFVASLNLLATPLLMNRLGLGGAVLGALLALPGIVVVLVALPASALSDYTGRRFALLSSFSCGLLAALLYHTAEAPLGIMLAQLLHGLSLAAFWPAITTLFSELAPPGGQARIQALNTVCQGLGLLIAPAIAGWLLNAQGFDALFLVYEASSLAGLALSLALRPPQKLRPTESLYPAVLGAFRKCVSLAQKDRALLVAGWGQFLSTALLYGVGGGFAIVHLEERDLTPAIIGLVITVREIAQTASRALFPRLSDRFPPERLLTLAPIWGALGIIGVVLAPGLWAVFAAIALHGFSLGLTAPAGNTLVALHTGPRERAVAMAYAVVASQLGAVVLPPAVGGLAAAAGLRAGIVISAALILVASWYLDRTVRGPEEPVSSQGRFATKQL